MERTMEKNAYQVERKKRNSTSPYLLVHSPCLPAFAETNPVLETAA
jgi:hypothetical protein